MSAEKAAVLRPDWAAPDGCRPIALDELRVVAVGHEADFLAVGLVGHLQSKPPRLGAHFTLREGADRETRARELILGQ